MLKRISIISIIILLTSLITCDSRVKQHQSTNFVDNNQQSPKINIEYTKTENTPVDNNQKINIKTGAEIITKNEFIHYKGLNIALVINRTAVDKSGKSILDYAIKSKNINLKSVFAPEHGLDTTYEDKFTDGNIKDIPVYSLYNETKKPTAEQLKDIDIIIFDIQDIGVRYYTYISTMALCMEAAKENNIKITVLDRPNPISGLKVFGDTTEKQYQGRFTSYFPIAMAHGMTIGELALLFNSEYKIDCNLEVIKIEGWKRKYYYDQLDLNWINPSPNIYDLESAILYSGLGILEAGNISVGRGTTKPFKYYGSPWIDSDVLLGELNQYNINGLTMSKVNFTPDKSIYKNEKCYGIEFAIIDREKINPLRTGIIIIKSIYKLYPNKYKFNRLKHMIGNSYIVDMIKSERPIQEIIESWKGRLESFKQIRKKYLLYD